MRLFEDIFSALLGEVKVEIRELTVWPMTARLGEPIRFRTVIYPKVNVELNNIIIRIFCYERAVHSTGKSNYVYTYTIHEERREFGPGLLISHQPMILEGEFIIPRTLPSSFTGRSNSILWEIEEKLVISGWPDVLKRFEIQVIPYQFPDKQIPTEQTPNIVPAK